MCRNFTLSGMCRDFTLGGMCRDFTLSGMCRDFTLSGMCRDYTPSAMCRDFTLSGMCRDSTPSAMCRDFTLDLPDFQKSSGKLAGRYAEVDEDEDAGPAKKRRVTTARHVRPTVMDKFKATDVSGVTQVSV